MKIKKYIASFHSKASQSRIAGYAFNMVAILALINLYIANQIFWSPSSHYKQLKVLQMANEERKEILQTVENKITLLSKEIDLLQNASVNSEYLDEVTRKKLNYSLKKEKVIVIS